MKSVATPNPHLAIDRLATLRRKMCALAAEEAALARRVFALPDGRHGGMAAIVEITTGSDNIRRIVVTEDLLTGPAPPAASGEVPIMPVQME